MALFLISKYRNVQIVGINCQGSSVVNTNILACASSTFTKSFNCANIKQQDRKLKQRLKTVEQSLEFNTQKNSVFQRSPGICFWGWFFSPINSTVQGISQSESKQHSAGKQSCFFWYPVVSSPEVQDAQPQSALLKLIIT